MHRAIDFSITSMRICCPVASDAVKSVLFYVTEISVSPQTAEMYLK